VPSADLDRGLAVNTLAAARDWARRVKRDAMTLWFARSHPDTPLVAKALGALVVAYALSPIDLIPDFIPVLGYVDDVLLLPALIWVAVRLLPDHVVEASRARADVWLATANPRPRSVTGAVVIVLIWLAVAAVCAVWIVSVMLKGAR
jgi:uncharacterized membrane protein YkvA (DUF1232 family)